MPLARAASSDTAPLAIDRLLAQQALSRAAGAPLLGGHAVELLIDASAHYDAWLAAIRGARQRVLLENYIIRNDEVGQAFLEALVERDYHRYGHIPAGSPKLY